MAVLLELNTRQNILMEVFLPFLLIMLFQSSITLTSIQTEKYFTSFIGHGNNNGFFPSCKNYGGAEVLQIIANLFFFFF